MSILDFLKKAFILSKFCIIRFENIAKKINNPFFSLILNKHDYRKIRKSFSKERLYDYSEVLRDFLENKRLKKIYNKFFNLYFSKKTNILKQNILFLIFTNQGDQYLFLNHLPLFDAQMIVIDLTDCWNNLVSNQKEISFDKYKQQIKIAFENFKSFYFKEILFSGLTFEFSIVQSYCLNNQIEVFLLLRLHKGSFFPHDFSIKLSTNSGSPLDDIKPEDGDTLIILRLHGMINERFSIEIAFDGNTHQEDFLI